MTGENGYVHRVFSDCFINQLNCSHSVVVLSPIPTARRERNMLFLNRHFFPVSHPIDISVYLAYSSSPDVRKICGMYYTCRT